MRNASRNDMEGQLIEATTWLDEVDTAQRRVCKHVHRVQYLFDSVDEQLQGAIEQLAIILISDEVEGKASDERVHRALRMLESAYDTMSGAKREGKKAGA